jgi:membrane-bound lytic murein transglycosylase MltF
MSSRQSRKNKTSTSKAGTRGNMRLSNSPADEIGIEERAYARHEESQEGRTASVRSVRTHSNYQLYPTGAPPIR